MCARVQYLDKGAPGWNPAGIEPGPKSYELRCRSRQLGEGVSQGGGRGVFLGGGGGGRVAGDGETLPRIWKDRTVFLGRWEACPHVVGVLEDRFLLFSFCLSFLYI